MFHQPTKPEKRRGKKIELTRSLRAYCMYTPWRLTVLDAASMSASVISSWCWRGFSTTEKSPKETSDLQKTKEADHFFVSQKYFHHNLDNLLTYQLSDNISGTLSKLVFSLSFRASFPRLWHFLFRSTCPPKTKPEQALTPKRAGCCYE